MPFRKSRSTGGKASITLSKGVRGSSPATAWGVPTPLASHSAFIFVGGCEPKAHDAPLWISRQGLLPAHSIRINPEEIYMSRSTVITDVIARDIRFPTSRSLDGSDAMNQAPDYSAAYVVLKTDSPDGLEGHGLTFTT